MAAQVRIGKIGASVTSPNAARVRLGRIRASVQPPTAAPRARIGKIKAAVTAGVSTGSLVRIAGAWRTVSPYVRKGGAWVPVTQRVRQGTAWKLLNPAPPSSGGQAPLPAVPGYTLVVADEFATLDPTRWYARDNDTFGNPNGQVQRWMARNVVISAASDGDGLSAKLISKREAVGGNPFTAGMLESALAGWYGPRYYCKEIDCRISHGQGVWQAGWSTAFTGGAGMVELDDMEIFHTQTPGRAMLTLHRATGRDSSGNLLTQYNVAKSKSADGYGGIFFEAPTATPGGRHKFTTKLWPVTDAAGTTPGDPNLPSANVRIQGFIDGVLKFDYVDTNALFWTTNGGDPADPINRFWNFRLQGSQINGKFVGHPDDPLGYSRLLNACLSINGGTAPDACATSFAGQPVLRAQFPNTFEIFSHRVWKYTG